jgi:hypothetical protein
MRDVCAMRSRARDERETRSRANATRARFAAHTHTRTSHAQKLALPSAPSAPAPSAAAAAPANSHTRAWRTCRARNSSACSAAGGTLPAASRPPERSSSARMRSRTSDGRAVEDSFRQTSTSTGMVEAMWRVRG